MSGCDVCIGGFDCGDVQFFHESKPKARKPHRCSECGNEIKPGEHYQRATGMCEGVIWRADSCLLCAEIREVFSCGKGETFGGRLWEDMQEYAFPQLTTASPCFRELSAAAKTEVLRRWRDWKGL